MHKLVLLVQIAPSITAVIVHILHVALAQIQRPFGGTLVEVVCESDGTIQSIPVH